MEPLNSWKWLGVVCAAALLLAATAKSDTYNFYFTKPKKNAGSTEEAPSELTAPKANPNQVTAVPNGQQPIIINNNNNVQMPSAGTAGLVAPSSSGTLANEATATVATGVLVDEGHRWHFGVSGAYYTGRRESYSDYNYFNNGSYTPDKQWAGLLDIGIDFTRFLGLNLYAAEIISGSGNGFDTGAELEISPIHIGGKFDVVRLGVLFGTGVALAIDNSSVPFGVGSRLTLNLDRQFGISASVRTNFHLTMAEAGIVTYF